MDYYVVTNLAAKKLIIIQQTVVDQFRKCSLYRIFYGFVIVINKRERNIYDELINSEHF